MEIVDVSVLVRDSVTIVCDSDDSVGVALPVGVMLM